jgi:hypothetical protein
MLDAEQSSERRARRKANDCNWAVCACSITHPEEQLTAGLWRQPLDEVL